MNVTLSIPEERVKDLLCSAWEGGSTYWAKAKVFSTPDKKFEYTWEIPFLGGEIILYDAEDGTQLGALTKATLERGLRVMAETYPRHFADFMNEDEDAETGDVFLQCAVMGELVYG